MVRFKKKGLLVVVSDDGSELDIVSSGLAVVTFLDQHVEIETGVTVSDIISVMEALQNSLDYVFDASLNGYPIKVFLDDAKQKSEPDPNMVRMEIVHEIDPISDSNSQLNEITGFVGIGSPGKDGEEHVYSVELSSAATYVHLELMLNKEYIIKKLTLDDDKNLVEEVLFEGTKEFTLYDVFHAILFEFSYHGSPPERDACLAELLLSFNDDDKNKESLTERLARYVADEEYEKAAEVRDEIKKIEQKKKRRI